MTAIPNATKTRQEWQEFYKNGINQALNLWFLPEVDRRQAAGLIPKPFPFIAGQVIFHADARPHQIRLNEEVTAILEVKYKDGLGLKIGDPVSGPDVEEFKAMELPAEEDPNCGHLTVIALNGRWYLFFNFVYNKGRARELLSTGREFLDTASDALAHDRFRAFVDTLFSAAEIAAHVLLMVSPSPSEATPYLSHGVIHSRFNRLAKSGRVAREHSISFNKLAAMRTRARYQKGVFHITPPAGLTLLTDVANLFDQANNLIAAKNRLRRNLVDQIADTA